jgi:hypothetical protein
MRFHGGLTVGLFLLASGIVPARATPLSLDVGGNFSSGSSIGTLNVGVNTVSGSVSDLEAGGFDFSVTLPSGFYISAGEWVVTNLENASVSLVGSEAPTQNGFAGSGSVGLYEPLDGETVADADTTYTLTNVPYLTAGDLVVSGSNNVFNCNADALCQISGYDYEIQYTVDSDPAAVPEPASLSLLGGGLIALGVLRRRKRNAA